MSAEEWVQVGSVGVDAGCLLLADPSYVWQQDQPDRYEQEVCCDWTAYRVLRFEKGHEGLGVLVSTGLGDGFYPVEVRWEDAGGFGRRIAEVRVRFLPHPYFPQEQLEAPPEAPESVGGRAALSLYAEALSDLQEQISSISGLARRAGYTASYAELAELVGRVSSDLDTELLDENLEP